MGESSLASDDRQARRRASGVTAEHRRGALLVEASAGTGKTTVLLDRVLAHLKSGEQRLRQIAVVTFTEAAAAELRERLGQRLSEARASGSAPWAERALAELELAPIGTLHGFCAELVRRRPQLVGVAPGFSIAGPFERRLRMQQAWEELLRFAPPSAEVLDAAAELGLSDEAALRRAAFGLLGVAPTALPRPLPDGLLEATARLLEVERLLDEASKRATGSLTTVVAEASRAVRRLAEQPAEVWQGELVRRGPPAAISGGRATRGTRRSARQLLATARQRLTALAADLVHQRLATLAAWLVQMDHRYETAMARLGALDFDQLVARAVELLDDPAARRAAQRYYPVVLVDEFQDTDAQQCELLHRLATPLGDDAPGLRSLVLVGDPKQSIYRFRGADLESYQRLREQLVGVGDTVRLSRSFRPLPRLAAWINQAMGEVMGGTTAAWEAAYAPLEASPPMASPELGGVVVVELETERRATAAVVREAEAAALATAARRLVVAPGSEVRTRRGDLRPASWRDLAVLLPRLTELEPYRRALVAAGVPHRVLGGGGTGKRPEVAALLALLRSVADPGDPVAAVAALRGPPFGCTDRSLAALALEGQPLDLAGPSSAASPGGPDREAAAEARAVYGRLRDLARRVEGRSLERVVSLLLEESGLMVHYALADPSGERCSVLDRIRLLAGRLQPIVGTSLHTATRALSVVLEEGEEGEIETPGEDDVVEILTIHRAKGLEFPVVLLGGLADGPPGGHGLRVLQRSRGGVALALTRRLASHGATAAIAREAERAAAEAKRLLYVAVSRARDVLVVPYLAGYRPRSLLFGPLVASGAVEPGAPEVAVRWSAADLAQAVAKPMGGGSLPREQRFADLQEPLSLGSFAPRAGDWSPEAPATLSRMLDDKANGRPPRVGEERRLARLLATPLGRRARAATRRWVGCWMTTKGGESPLAAPIDLAFRGDRGLVVIALAAAPAGRIPDRLHDACAVLEAALEEPVVEAVVWDRSAPSRRVRPRAVERQP